MPFVTILSIQYQSKAQASYRVYPRIHYTSYRLIKQYRQAHTWAKLCAYHR